MSDECVWTLDDEDAHETACGELHGFIAGGVAENNYQFCPYCGRKIVVARLANMRTSQQLVDEANALARSFYRMHGNDVSEGYRFDQARHPQERGCWNMAVAAYDHIEGTDVENALDEIEEVQQ